MSGMFMFSSKGFKGLVPQAGGGLGGRIGQDEIQGNGRREFGENLESSWIASPALSGKASPVLESPPWGLGMS